ncbi:hypothetical protein [Rouxiella badensis]|jgi:hypothetical protein|uniref:Uncharacterized protein n=1 Tax=Rouxiella badensis TaxID=1646377 RepID=A0A1X0WAD4_9GAMM|nr:hypothetical protein [Rouxiella badensis]MCC3703610.1 hypothetical protein [Rouxiella badensis]MCC3720585.1 hypothetical protein [Rouxiella badensis]MCC3730424.1 hypothetical protein [Rouxiella badensis]MCC3734458.1 hypothetical protein [Rouxiella badensis]MCC3742740.1 hypothetical protein [Rouxiella badensis]
MSTDNGGQAFPRPYSKDDWLEEHNYAQDGMSLRDFLAAKAMLGLVISEGSASAANGYADLSTASYALADAMLAERSKS